jgi:hypothetical protein
MPGAGRQAKGTKSLFAGTPGVMLLVEGADRVGGGLGAALHAQLGERADT